MNKKINDKILKYNAVFEEAEEGGYTVLVPTLPGCVSEGETFEEARENIKEAITAYLESLCKDGETILKPKSTIVGTVDIPASGFSFGC